MANGENESLRVRLSRRLNHTDVRDVCKIFIVIFLIGLAVSFVTAARNQGQTIFGEALGADFPAFYAAGKIINEYGADRLYDRALQKQIYHQLFPLEDPQSALVYANAPFFFLVFPLLAKLPYAWAYAGWILISIALYLGGITLLWRSMKNVPSDAYHTAMMVAVTFFPFMMECLGGGQTTPLAFFCLAAVLTLERKGQLIASGVVLALMIYKPTLLLLIGPMLVLTRRWYTLAGMAIGACGLALVSAALVGWSGLWAWGQTLLFYSQSSTGAATTLRTWKYVDINSFSRGLWGDHQLLRWLTAGLCVLAFVPQLLRSWWLANGRDDLPRQASWAVTLAWLPVLNVYLGFYDATLVGLSVMLVTEWFYQQGTELPANYRLGLLAFYLSPWISQRLAQTVGIQLFTLVMMIWGAYVLRLVALTRVSAWQASFNLVQTVNISPRLAQKDPGQNDSALASTNS